jgi:nicotinate phosphoribosyltransferase
MRALYLPSLTLLTDLYQLTMMYGYWQTGLWDRGAESCFHLFYRRAPFGGKQAIACGIDTAIDWMEQVRFTSDDIDYLSTLIGNDGRPLFAEGFLQVLARYRLRARVYAVNEGQSVVPHAPILRVEGPIADCQLLETALLNIINFQTLIATKARRICDAASGDPVLEFGLRRAQGIDGALAASRAAYVGGVSATSNVLAGKLYGIPVKGTHAHSWVMCFGDELEAFERWAKSMPNNAVFLVDTYDTETGVQRAIEVGKGMRELGHEMLGVRLDSGDLSALSRSARHLLDEAGFENAVIVASNDLDEHRVRALKESGARIGVWGIGTRLVTGHDQPALGGVYKLAAVREDAGEEWSPRIKLSEDPIKVSNPGRQSVLRCGAYDVIVPVERQERLPRAAYDYNGKRVELAPNLQGEELLTLAFERGSRVRPKDSMKDARARASQGLTEHRQGLLSESLFRLKSELSGGLR